MTEEIKDKIDEACCLCYAYAGFGCIDNCWIVTQSADGLVRKCAKLAEEDSDLVSDAMWSELSSKIEKGLKGISWKSSQPDKIRAKLVIRWIRKRYSI